MTAPFFPMIRPFKNQQFVEQPKDELVDVNGALGFISVSVCFLNGARDFACGRGVSVADYGLKAVRFSAER